MTDAAIGETVSSRPPLYGWVIVGATLLLLALVNGLTLAGLSVFDDTIIRSLHISIGALKFRDLLGLICSGLAAPFIGYAVDRIGVRPVIALGLALIVVSMLLYAQVTSVWHVYGIHILLGVAFAATNIVVIIVLLAQWFETKRGLALGIVLAGTSVGGTIFPPLVAPLIAAYGWQNAFRILAIVPLLFIPVLLLIVRERGIRAPSARKDNTSTNNASTTGTDAPRNWFALAWSREFLMIVLVAIAVFYSANTFIRHTFLFMRLSGADAGTAAAGISTVFLFGLFGKIIAGIALEYIGLRWVFIAYQLATLAGTLMLMTTGATYATFSLALIGLGWGGGYTLTQLTAARFFAGPGLGRMIGGFVVIESLSQGLGSFLSGVLHDIVGSYTLPFGVVAVLMIGALLCTVTAQTFRTQPGRV